MGISFGRTLRTIALPVLLTVPVFTPGPSCSGGSSSSSGCSRQGDSIVDVYEPTTVTDLTVTVTSPTSIRLTWSPSEDNYAGVIGYQIRRDPSDGALGWSDRTWYVDPGLEPGATYCYEVRAVDAQGNRARWGAKVCATTPSSGEPRSVRVVSIGIGQDGAVRVATYATVSRDLIHAVKRSGTPRVEVIDRAGPAGRLVFIAVDPGRVVYTDDTHGALLCSALPWGAWTWLGILTPD